MRDLALISAVVFSFLSLGRGQDIHQSQFYTSPLNLNPALTGNFFGDTRLAANFRNQWFVNDLANYLTYSLSVDHRFYPRSWKQRGLWSAGLLINYDQAGDSRLGLTHVGLSAGYSLTINTNNIITLGGLVAGSSRRFNVNNLTWDAQWDGRAYNPSLPSGENASPASNFFMDLSGGINYRWQKSRRTKVDAGIGGFHLNRPDQIFYSQNSKQKLNSRIAVYVMPSIRMGHRADLLLHGLFQSQAPYKETVVGAYGKFYLSTHRGKEFNVLLGAAFRPGDAFIPKIAAEYKNWYAGASYDINTSPFKIATNRRGGPEFSLIYVFVKARPLEQIRACPIF